jgi:hypothetical protein
MDLEKLKTLCANTTPGPWTATVVGGFDDDPVWGVHGADTSYEATICETWSHEHDPECIASFIAVSRTAVPDLIAEVERLRKALDEALNVCEALGRELRPDWVGSVLDIPQIPIPTLAACLREREQS